MNWLLAFIAAVWRSTFGAVNMAAQTDGRIRIPRDPLAIVGKNNQIETIWLPVTANRVVPCNARIIENGREKVKARDSP